MRLGTLLAGTLLIGVARFGSGNGTSSLHCIARLEVEPKDQKEQGNRESRAGDLKFQGCVKRGQGNFAERLALARSNLALKQLLVG